MTDASDGGAAAGIDDDTVGGEGEVDAGGMGDGVGFVGEGAVEEGGVAGGAFLGGGGLEAVGWDGGVGVESWIGGAVRGHDCGRVVYILVWKTRRGRRLERNLERLFGFLIAR